MTQNTISSSIQLLALQWRALGLCAVAFAKQISLSQKMGAHVGADQAAMLEAWLFTAITKLATHISDFAAYGEPVNDEDRLALEYLKIAYTYLSVLALLITAMRRDMELAHAQPHLVAGKSPTGIDEFTTACADDVPYLDSS